LATLYVVGTPIGNLGDLSARAAETLRLVTRVFAEDTRRTRSLLAHLGILGKPVIRLDAHAELGRVTRLVEGLEHDESVALVTDAGTPGVSDPGALLVRTALEHGVRVVPIPGASAVTAAVAASGLVEGPFLFLGFLPRHGKKRTAALERLTASDEPVVLFESAQRLSETLAEFAKLQPERRAVLCRELTKLHEEILAGTLSELAGIEREWLGEVTLVLAASPRPDAPAEEPADLDAEIERRLAKGAHAKELASELAGRLGLPRRALYARVLAVRERLR
jgi:16S rRNA (cytidine1402-2'-O)-methyltransferase